MSCLSVFFSLNNDFISSAFNLIVFFVSLSHYCLEQNVLSPSLMYLATNVYKHSHNDIAISWIFLCPISILTVLMASQPSVLNKHWLFFLIYACIHMFGLDFHPNDHSRFSDSHSKKYNELVKCYVKYCGIPFDRRRLSFVLILTLSLFLWLDVNHRFLDIIFRSVSFRSRDSLASHLLHKLHFLLRRSSEVWTSWEWLRFGQSITDSGSWLRSAVLITVESM